MGGFAKHMMHPYEYTEFSANDLVELIDLLFHDKIENIKEKLDGFNLMATMNNEGQVVFIRNSSNLNSENGGFTIDDIKIKWEGKEQQINVFTSAALIIEKIFNKLGKEFFNLDSTHRKVINCECIIKGQTNVIPYISNRVAFHGYKLFELIDNKWIEIKDIEGDVDDIYEIAKGIEEAKPRPNLKISSLENSDILYKKFRKALLRLWKNEGLDYNASIKDWKKQRFKKFAYDWFKEDIDIFNRICNEDKTVNANELKKRYPEHLDEIKKLDKEIRKKITGQIMRPLDNLFLQIGNELIDLLKGFINSDNKEEIIKIIKSNVNDIIKLKNNSTIQKSVNRLNHLNNKYNAAEGIVVVYKGKRMKFTGSFAPINQILGIRFEL